MNIDENDPLKSLTCRFFIDAAPDDLEK